MPSLIDLLSPISQKLCIVSDGATGEQKSQAWLMNEVAQRSTYCNIDSHEIEVRPSEPEDGAALSDFGELQASERASERFQTPLLPIRTASGVYM